MKRQVDPARNIPETMVFTGKRSRQGYKLNKFCIGLTDAANREAFKADPDAYMAKAGLPEETQALIRAHDYLGLIESGGNIYLVMKIGACLGDGLYRIGAQQRGETYEEFLATRNASGAR